MATALGIFLFLTPWAALGAMLVFVLVLLNWGYVSLASLSAALFMPGLIWLIYNSDFFKISGVTWPFPGLECLLALVVAGLIWFKHHDNIARLLSGDEKKWRRSGS